MNKPEMQEKLLANHRQFTDALTQLSEAEFIHSAGGKWTAGQQLEHIHLSIEALSNALKFPKFLLRYRFGKANRPSKTYDELVAKYLSRLQAGGVAPSPFIPPAVLYAERNEKINTVQKSVEQLWQRSDRYSEEQLDSYILPHPLLGRQTVRELLYFTTYHVQHHEEIMKRNLKQ